MALIKSTAASHFTDALAQNAIEYESLNGCPKGGGEITTIEIISAENLAWRVWLFDTNGNAPGTIASNHAVAFHTFAVSDGVQIAGAGHYHYTLKAAGIYYVTETGNLEIGIQNTSAGAKTATSGETGALRVKVGIKSAHP